MDSKRRKASQFEKISSDPNLQLEESPSPRMQIEPDYELKLDALIRRVERARRILVEI